MYKNKKILAIIPARGNSKGIPGKNLKLLNNKPLIDHIIEKTKASQYIDKIVVTTDSEEIIRNCEKFKKIKIIKRGNNLSNDKTTLDPVVVDAVNKIEEEFDYIFTFQTTSPLIKVKTINEGIKKIIDETSETLITVTDDKHLAWTIINGKVKPLFKKRLNRQELPIQLKETGGIIACSQEVLKSGTRIGKKISLLEISNEESIDIDTYSDFILAEELLKKITVGIVVIGNKTTGMGHIYRTLTLANRLRFKPLFFINEKDTIAIEKIKNTFYPVKIFSNKKELMQELEANNIELVINDTLDTSTDYIEALKKNERFVVSFEDLGQGSEICDLTINALYESSASNENKLFGYKWLCLRDEFLFAKKKKFSETVKNILITFGGTDPNNITNFCLNILKDENVQIKVILGPGYPQKKELKEKYKTKSNIKILDSVKSMRPHMEEADIAITSNGRTVYELVSLNIPSIVFCQNEREIKHTFGDVTQTTINLGLFSNINKEKVKKTFFELRNNNEKRKRLIENMKKIDLEKGTERVIKKILETYYQVKK